MRIMKPRFFSFEGIEGCGKSTQWRMLGDYIEAQGIAVEMMREPGGVPIAEAIRGILLDPANAAMSSSTELLLYAASRAQLIEERIAPALAAGKVVVSDRYADSTTAYQGAGRGLDPERIEQLHNIATGGLWPVKTFLLDLPVEAGLERARTRGRADRIEQEALPFHQRVRDAYLVVARMHPERFVVLDARQSIEALHAEICAVADEVLGLNRL
jgi:dTMP kinase